MVRKGHKWSDTPDEVERIRSSCWRQKPQNETLNQMGSPSDTSCSNMDMNLNRNGILPYTPPQRRPGYSKLTLPSPHDSVAQKPTTSRGNLAIPRARNNPPLTPNRKTNLSLHPKRPHDATSRGLSHQITQSGMSLTGQTPDNKDTSCGTARSEGSDENLLQNRGRGLRSGSHQEVGHSNLLPLTGVTRDKRLSDETKKTPQDTEPEGVSLNKPGVMGNSPPESENCPSQEGSDNSENAHQDPMDELKQLQGQMVARAHMNRFQDPTYPTANPDILAKCRDGPGTDPHSDVYKDIAKARLVQQGEPSYSSNASQPLETAFTNSTERPSSKSSATQRELYGRCPALYPIITDGELSFSREPTSKQKEILGNIRRSRDDENFPTHYKPQKVRKKDWTDVIIPNWEYSPRVCPNFEAFRKSFSLWLDNTITLACYVDIYHQAFFNGTGHADGKRSFFISDWECRDTFLNTPDDEQSRIHVHENAEGYCHNLRIHIKREEEEEQNRRKVAREIYFQGIQSPTQLSPMTQKANVYLRPAKISDIGEIMRIYSWYAKNSTIGVDVEALDAEDVRQRIEECNDQQLPFIVAVDRKIVSAEKILGYARATDFVGSHTAGRFTAVLEVFVTEKHKRRGIGRSLLDKLLEICDPTYIPKSGYIFEASSGERSGYYGGGRRRLACLIFMFSYLDGNTPEYHWVKDWLNKDYQFKEQGLLKGARVKFGKLLVAP